MAIRVPAIYLQSCAITLVDDFFHFRANIFDLNLYQSLTCSIFFQIGSLGPMHFTTTTPKEPLLLSSYLQSGMPTMYKNHARFIYKVCLHLFCVSSHKIIASNHGGDSKHPTRVRCPPKQHYRGAPFCNCKQKF